MWQERVWIAQGRVDLAARVLVAQEKLGEAVDLLTRIHAFARKNGLVARDIEVLSVSALALQADGDTEQIVNTIASTRSIAEAASFIRALVDENEGAKRPIVDETNAGLIEPLSDRELDVLRLIAHGFSNQKIGERLFISLHIVKSHPWNLFAKLEARSRTAAANKTRGLGLLPPL
jgi:LuxR family maltose regulon positive regulatory protein